MVGNDVMLAGLCALLWNIGRKTNRARAHFSTLFRSNDTHLCSSVPVSISTMSFSGILIVLFSVAVGTLCFYLDVSQMINEIAEAHIMPIVLPRELLGPHPPPSFATQDCKLCKNRISRYDTDC